MKATHLYFMIWSLFIFCTTPTMAFEYMADANAKVKPQSPSDLNTSLHATARGMKYFFEREDGFGPYSGIDYDDIGCKDCHVQENDCTVCHGDFSSNKAQQTETCEVCHGRQTKEKALGVRGVHMTDEGMTCASCHSSDEIHGDGNEYQSMLEPGVFDTKCENCHDNISSSYSHDQHTNTLECATCHVKTALTCYNCHFESMVEDHVKRPIKAFGNFVLLVNDERSGKVNTGSYQSVYYQDKRFVIFAPFMGHTVTNEARQCEDCHANEAMQMLASTGEIEMTKWENDTVTHLSGAIPLVEESKIKMQYVDYDKETETWSPAGIGPDKVQFGYCTPLTEEQLSKLQTPQSTEVKEWKNY